MTRLILEIIYFWTGAPSKKISLHKLMIICIIVIPARKQPQKQRFAQSQIEAELSWLHRYSKNTKWRTKELSTRTKLCL